ncbi:MAG: hypothetical protein F4X25_03755 [Chloroflexi bacterium]|nr:hypothetical protein [Chloroflexota bacterium]
MARPGPTRIAFTNDRTNARVSVISLVRRNSLISSANAAMVSALSSNTRRSASIARLVGPLSASSTYSRVTT